MKCAIAEVQLGKAMKFLLSDGLINPSREVVQEMLAKYLQNPSPSLPMKMPPSPEIPEALVLKATQSFSVGFVPEPSGLRADRLKEAVLCPSFTRAIRALQSLSATVKEFSAECTSPEVIPHLCGASLLAS